MSLDSICRRNASRSDYQLDRGFAIWIKKQIIYFQEISINCLFPNYDIEEFFEYLSDLRHSVTHKWHRKMSHHERQSQKLSESTTETAVLKLNLVRFYR